jgi:hypothetical protein
MRARAEDIKLAIWRIHRKIGMSGGLFSDMLLRETGLRIDSACVDRLRRRHAAAYRRRVADIHPLPSTSELLSYLTEARIPWAIAMDGRGTADPRSDRSRSRVRARGHARLKHGKRMRDSPHLKIRVVLACKIDFGQFWASDLVLPRGGVTVQTMPIGQCNLPHTAAQAKTSLQTLQGSLAQWPWRSEKLGTIEYVLSVGGMRVEHLVNECVIS